MTKPGHIRVKDNKLWFEYYKLPKPKWCKIINTQYQMDVAMRKYEASKRTIKVSNEYSLNLTGNQVHLGFKNKLGKLIDLITNIKNGQSCIAEITDNKATIVKII